MRALVSAGTGHSPEGESIGLDGGTAIAMEQIDHCVLLHRYHWAVLLSARERQ